MESSSTGAKHGFEGKYGYFNVAIIILSIYVLVVLFLDTFVQFPDRTSKLISRIDWFICGIFFIDWIVRFMDAESKLKFMRWGWIDLIACMPALPFIRVGRLFGLIRLLRLIRAFKSIKQFVHHFFANRAEGAFFSALIISFLIMLICSISILQVEVDPQSTIKTADDALWWSYFTLTTGSYVDKFPVTDAGKFIAAILSICGLALFGTFTAFVARWFFGEQVLEAIEKKQK